MCESECVCNQFLAWVSDGIVDKERKKERER